MGVFSRRNFTIQPSADERAAELLGEQAIEKEREEEQEQEKDSPLVE